MKASLLMFFCTLSLLTAAQNRSAIGLTTSLDLNYRDFRPQSDLHEWLTESRNNLESALPTLRFGVEYLHPINSRWTFRVGARMARGGYQMKTEVILVSSFSEAPENTLVTEDPAFVGPFEWREEFDFWEIPVAVQYQFHRSPWLPYVELGMSPHLLRDERELVNGEPATPLPPEFQTTTQKLQLVGSLGIGWRIPVGKYWQTYAQPTFRYHLTELYENPDDELIETHLWNGGLEVGIRRRL